MQIIIDRHFIAHCELEFNKRPITSVHINYVKFDNYVGFSDQEKQVKLSLEICLEFSVLFYVSFRFIKFIASLCATEYYWNYTIFHSAFSIECVLDAMVQVGICRKLLGYYDYTVRTTELGPKINIFLESARISAWAWVWELAEVRTCQLGKHAHSGCAPDGNCDCKLS